MINSFIVDNVLEKPKLINKYKEWFDLEREEVRKLTNSAG